MATEHSVFEYRAKKNIDKEKENQVPNAFPFLAKLKLLTSDSWDNNQGHL